MDLAAAVDEVHPRGDHGLAGFGVLEDVLGDEERHRLALAVLLVDVGDLALALEDVADHERTVVLELLLAVEDEAALLHQRPDDLHHRVAAGVGVGRLLLGERAPVGHGEAVCRRHRDVVEAVLLGHLGVLVDRVVVGHGLGEVGHRRPLDCDLRLPGGGSDEALVDGHVSLLERRWRLGPAHSTPATLNLTNASVFLEGCFVWVWWTGRSRSSPVPDTASAGARRSYWPRKAPRSWSTTWAVRSAVRAPTSGPPRRSRRSSARPAARQSPTTTTSPAGTGPRT